MFNKCFYILCKMYWIKINLFKVLSTLDDTVSNSLITRLCLQAYLFLCIWNSICCVLCTNTFRWRNTFIVCYYLSVYVKGIFYELFPWLTAIIIIYFIIMFGNIKEYIQYFWFFIYPLESIYILVSFPFAFYCV